MIKLTVVALLAMVPLGADAQVHRCTDAKGVASYSDVPCGGATVKADRFLGREATERRWEPEGYRLQEQLDISERLGRDHRENEERQRAINAANAQAARNAPRLDAYNPNERIDAQSERNMQRRMAELQASQSMRQGVERQLPGRLVNCDQAGCWGSENGVRYTFVAGGNLKGKDGSLCKRGAYDTFKCN